MKFIGRWMLCRSGHFSLRELFGVILVVAVVSVIATYHISKYVLQRQQTELKIQFNGRVDIYRSFRVKGGGGSNNKDRQGLEGIDLEQQAHAGGGPTGDGARGGGGSKGTRAGRHSHKATALYKKLVEVEEAELGAGEATEHSPQVALLCGDVTAVKQTLALYVHALTRVGYNVTTADGIVKRNASLSIEGDLSCESATRHQGSSSWSILMCLSDGQSDGVCLQQAAPLNTGDQVQHRVNRIAPLVEHLGTKSSLCETLSSVSHIPTLRRSQLAPPCFHLPAQWSNYLVMADAFGKDTRWVFKPSHDHQQYQQIISHITPDSDNYGSVNMRQQQHQYQRHQGQQSVILVQPTKNRDFSKLKELSQRDSVVQLYQEHPLLLFGMPFSVTVFVLVTSLSPLRVYMHADGVVHYRHDYQRNFKKVSGRTWSLERLKQHIEQTHSKDTATAMSSNLQSVVVQTLLVTDAVSRDDQRCEHCFQLLGFEVIFNSSFHPIVLEVSTQPDLGDLGLSQEVPGFSGRSSLVDDMLSLVLGSASVAADVAKALEEINHRIGVTGVDCQRTHDVCLTPADLRHLLAARREAINKSAFTQLYPSTEADRYTSLIEELHKFSRHSKRGGTYSSHNSLRKPQRAPPEDGGAGDGGSGWHHTAALHPVLVSMARFYHSIDAVEDSYDDLNVPLFQENRNSRQYSAKLVQNIFQNTSTVDKKYARQSCSEDKSTKPLLAGLYTEPTLNITPAFSPEVVEYYATVPYDIFLTKVWAIAQSCDCEARLDDKYGLSRPSNYTLGLGSNKISVLVVDVTHTEPWILTAYTLSVYRRSPGEGGPVPTGAAAARLNSGQAVCALQQDCGLRLSLDAPCGLQRAPYASYTDFRSRAAQLPVCRSGAASGRWMVACGDCAHRDSCDWSDALWQPDECNHPRMARDDLKRCLAGKQILFIGDSTNRGMMHYLMEAANDSLTEWDKTHHIKVYTNVNQARTTVSFAYYPQFWLPAAQRPVFDKALYQLMKQSGPLANNAQTVLVVGGVHWLATHHLNVITKALQREGLSNIRVIIKGLGAGFHQPVDGLHCLTQREHRKLVLHNSGLMEYARQSGFEVVDTFNMTMARYKDFLQGKCACHFHRVREVLPSFTQFLQSTGRHGNGTLMDMPIVYHVDGEINAAYTEILFNGICRQHA